MAKIAKVPPVETPAVETPISASDALRRLAANVPGASAPIDPERPFKGYCAWSECKKAILGGPGTIVVTTKDGSVYHGHCRDTMDRPRKPTKGFEVRSSWGRKSRRRKKS